MSARIHYRGIVTAAVLVLALLGGVALLAIGLRGRRVDDHPVCRRCGRDWYGAGFDRCPECGVEATTANLRVGNRQRRPRLAAAGATLATLAAVPLLAWAAVAATGADLDRHKPLWLLLYESQSSQSAAAEIDRRHVDGELNAEETARVAARWLDDQGEVDLPWLFEKGDLLFRLDVAGTLSPADRQRLYEQAVGPTLQVRRRARSGGELPVYVSGLTRGSTGPTSNFSGPISAPVEIHYSLVRDGRRFAARRDSTGVGPGITVHNWLSLDGVPPGSYGLAVEPQPPGRRLSNRQILALSTTPPEPILPVEVVAANESTVEVVNDPALRDEVAQKVRVAAWGVNGDEVEGVVVEENEPSDGPGFDTRWMLDTERLVSDGPVPIGLAYDLYLDDGSRRWFAGNVDVAEGSEMIGMGSAGADLPAEFDADVVDAVLVPSIEEAESTPHLTRILGGEIVFEAVPVWWRYRDRDGHEQTSRRRPSTLPMRGG